ncbi:MAG: tRNA pseudouridine(38-40) synthase TruA [Oscillospiraceae bacterium]|nr:tRNA pseudouridine(38-40) synthase TruA [Oscillospiraceae bacterium]
MPNYKLILQYDGSRYRGWQRLSDTEMTIQGKTEAVLSRLFETLVEVQGSGRTDAGVHALGQVASFHSPRDLPPGELLAALRQYLPEDIGAVSVEYAPPRFHARLSALEKTYRYRVWTTEAPCVFDRRFVYLLPGRYSIPAMEAAARLLEGTHDFRAFSAVKTKKSTLRTLSRIEIRQAGDELQFDFTADGFLHHMVRILTGTLLEVGRGERSPAEAAALLDAGDRAAAGFTVPAKGLCLMEVRYDQTL